MAALRRWLRFFTVFPVAALATGCAALNDRHEQTWLALHAIDSAQTYSIVDDPCFREGHPVTSKLVSEQPTSERVIAWSVASAAAHVAVTDYLLRTERTKLARFWQYLTIGEKAYFAGRNYYLGVRIGGKNRCAS